MEGEGRRVTGGGRRVKGEGRRVKGVGTGTGGGGGGVQPELAGAGTSGEAQVMLAVVRTQELK